MRKGFLDPSVPCCLMKGGRLTLDSICIPALVTSIKSRILVPAIGSTDDVSHIHVLQDVLQKLHQSRYHGHPEFATGYVVGERYSTIHAPASPFTLDEVVAVLRDNLDHQDH